MSNITVTVSTKCADGYTAATKINDELQASVGKDIKIHCTVASSGCTVPFSVTYKVYAKTGEGCACVCGENEWLREIPTKYFEDKQLYTVVRAITIKGLEYRFSPN